MAIGHISIRVHTRSKGHSAAAGLAYRMGVDLVDPRTGVEHLYARRTRLGDIVDCGMSGAGLFGDVAALAAAIEAAEKRKNSSLMRDVQIALPWELNDEQCVELTSEFSELLARRYRTHTAWSVHRPDKRGDARNKHGHIAVPTRELDAGGGGFGKKLRILDEHKTGRIEVAEIRQLWEERANTHLERAGHAARVYVGRRDDGNPVPTLGAGCTALEREAAEDRGEEVENRSVADLVSTGEAVTWRGKALRRHQLGAKQQARQEGRASAPADEQEVATIVVSTAEPRAVAAPARVGVGAPPMTRPANRVREARPEAVATPARPGAERGKGSGLQVGEVQVHAVAVPMKIAMAPAHRSEGLPRYDEVRVHAVATPTRIEQIPRRRHRASAVHEIEVQRTARPVRVRFGGASPSPSIPAEVAPARPKPVAAPRRPPARSRPAASPVRVRSVREAVRAAPQEQDLRALETPPSLQEIADQLRAAVYGGEDAVAARRPADRHRGLAIGYANWGAVREAVRHDGDLCGKVAALASSRAAAEGQRDYDIHPSWAGRIADWIRETVAAGLALIGLRRRGKERAQRWRWQQLTRSAAAKAREALPKTYEPYMPDRTPVWRTSVLALSDPSFQKIHRRLDADTETDRLGRSVVEHLMNADRENADLRAAAEQQNKKIRDEIDPAAMSEKREIARKKLTGWFRKPSDDAIRIEANRTKLPPERYRELTRDAIERHIDRAVEIIREVCDRTLQHHRDDRGVRDTPSARSERERASLVERDQGHDRGGWSR